ncbi:MAG: TOTE conflict system archaeo-eukaryotic primase domain-containing protein [Candidatus Heimdallarchaeaceae archaeon]
MISPLLVTKFRELFSGNDEAFGKYTIKSSEGDKVTGNAYTEIGTVKQELYQNHLEGKTGLGIIPINKNNQCKFGAIDIDDYHINFKKIHELIMNNSIPLVLFRSKSGGAHLFLFLKTWTSAASVQDALSFFGILLGYKKAEIFPKQKKLEKNKVGNWINLPYFNADKTQRYAYNNENKKIDLFEAIKLIEEKAIDISELEKLIENFPNKEAPPCLQYLLSGLNVEKGERNSFLFNTGIYFKQIMPDTWQNELVEINNKLKEPLSINELSKSIINSLNKKEYFYTCRNEPIVSYCDKTLCRQRKFGIDSDSIPSEIIGGLIKIDFKNEPLWELNVNGVNLTFKTNELMSHIIYQQKCFEALHTWPKTLKKETWRKIIEERLNNVEIQKGPGEASQDGLFLRHLTVFCTERAEAVTKAQILNKRVYTNEGFHYFRLEDFIEFLKFNNFTFYSTPIIWKRLRELGAIPIVFRLGEEKKIRVWRLKLIDNPRIDVDVETIKFEKYDREPF